MTKAKTKDVSKIAQYIAHCWGCEVDKLPKRYASHLSGVWAFHKAGRLDMVAYIKEVPRSMFDKQGFFYVELDAYHELAGFSNAGIGTFVILEAEGEYFSVGFDTIRPHFVYVKSTTGKAPYARIAAGQFQPLKLK